MDVFAAIADPTRREMIDMLREGPLPAGAFVQRFPNVSQPAVSQHLKVLRDCQLVTVEADRQRRIYTLRRAGLDAVSNWVAPYIGDEPAQVRPKPAARVKPRLPKAAAEQPVMLDLFG